MLIRELFHNDRPEIEKFVNQTANFSVEEKDCAMELIDVVLQNKNQTDYTMRIAEVENKPVGYYCVGKRALTKGVYDLFWIVVDPNYANKKIGSLLLLNAEEYIKQNNGNFIWVETSSREDYLLTRNFYIKNNYDQILLVKNFYKENDDLIVFGKYL